MKMNKKGFTIVELVIVIAVIAILAAVLIPTFSGLVEKAQDSATIQEARNRYTEFVGMYDYTSGTPIPQDLVIEVENGNEKHYVAVKDGSLVANVRDTIVEAKGDTDAGAFLYCAVHEWEEQPVADPVGYNAPQCSECEQKCTKTVATLTEDTCPNCELAKTVHPAN